MKTTALVALIGLLLAAVDFFGFARQVEARVRVLMVYLWEWGGWLFEKGFDGWNYVNIGVTAVGLVLFSIVGFEWVSGIEIFGGVEGFKNSNSPAKKVLDDVIATAFALALTVVAAGAAALVTWGVFWLLAWPKRGVVSSLGLLMAVAGVGLEFVQ